MLQKEKCIDGTEYECKRRKLKRREGKVLSTAAKGLDGEPSDLHKTEEACEAVGFILIPDSSFFNFGVVQITVSDQVHSLLAVDWKWREIGAIKP